MHLQPLAIDGVFRAIPGVKGGRTFDWYREDVLAPALPSAWRPSFGTTHTALLGHVEGLYRDQDHRVVTCVSGRVALVVMDARVGLPTSNRWIPLDLDTVNRVTVVIPPHAAWGFQACAPNTALLSLHRGTQLSSHAFDPALGIVWPLPVSN